MKIIALHQQYQGYTPAAIVELSGEELDLILPKGDCERASKLHLGQAVEIGKRWRHLREIEGKVRDAATLPQRLRTLADMLDMNVPAIEAVIAPPVSDEAGV